MRAARLLAPAILAFMIMAPAPAGAVAVVSSTTTLYNFDAAGGWWVAGGPGSLTEVSSPKTSGTGALQVHYDFSKGSQVLLAPSTTPALLPELPQTVSLDVYGDQSWNVIYIQLRDATGEIFHIRAGNLSFSGWQTLQIHPAVTVPANTLAGDGDHVIDLPVSLFRIVVDRNPGGTKTASSIVIDHLTVSHQPWSPLRSDRPVFVPSAGQATTLRVGPPTAGSFSVKLTDELGQTVTWNGTSAGGAAVSSWGWDGRTSGGALMVGSISARLTLTDANGTRQFDVPYLVGLAARYENTIPGSIVGVNSRLTTMSTADRSTAARVARQMEGAWVRWAREGFDWNRVEPRQGDYDWPTFDQAVALLTAHHIDVVGMLGYSASWASSAPSAVTGSARLLYPPKLVSDYASYVSAVVARYKDRIHVWEIWNEPDNATFWRPAPQASAYAALLKAAYAAIKAQEPDATVLIGGLVGTDITFLDGIRAAGGWSSFDALAIHTYVSDAPEAGQFTAWIDRAEAYLAKHGAKPLWITELGWSTGVGGVSDTAQGDYLARSYLTAANAGVAGILWYDMVEDGGSTSTIDNYGLVRQDGTAKSAYFALRRVGELLDQGTTAGTVDPAAGSRAVADPIDGTTGWTVHTLQGGWAGISTGVGRDGRGALRLDYNLTSGGTGVQLDHPVTLPGSPSSVSVWVYGDGSANAVYVKLADATGEVYSADIGSLMRGWHRLTLWLDGANPNWTVTGGDGNKQVDYPLTLRSLFVYTSGIGQTAGSATFDSIEVGYGSPVRGVVVSRRGGVVQSIYSLKGSPTVAVPVTGTRAWLVDGGASAGLPVSDGSVQVTVGSRPVNVLTTIGGAPASISPNGDGVNDTATLTWFSGDRTHYTFQVINVHTGEVVRNVAVSQWVDAGLQTLEWDGLVGGAPAPPGGYRLRLAILGPDGRVSYLWRNVTVV